MFADTMNQKSLTTQVQNRNGLHARPATMFAQVCNNFKSEITVQYQDETAHGNNILEMMALAIEQGVDFLIRASGDDADNCINALQRLIDSKFGETE